LLCSSQVLDESNGPGREFVRAIIPFIRQQAEPITATITVDGVLVQDKLLPAPMTKDDYVAHMGKVKLTSQVQQRAAARKTAARVPDESEEEEEDVEGEEREEDSDEEDEQVEEEEARELVREHTRQRAREMRRPERYQQHSPPPGSTGPAATRVSMRQSSKRQRTSADEQKEPADEASTAEADTASYHSRARRKPRSATLQLRVQSEEVAEAANRMEGLAAAGDQIMDEPAPNRTTSSSSTGSAATTASFKTNVTGVDRPSIPLLTIDESAAAPSSDPLPPLGLSPTSLRSSSSAIHFLSDIISSMSSVSVPVSAEPMQIFVEKEAARQSQPPSVPLPSILVSPLLAVTPEIPHHHGSPAITAAPITSLQDSPSIQAAPTEFEPLGSVTGSVGGSIGRQGSAGVDSTSSRTHNSGEAPASLASFAGEGRTASDERGRAFDASSIIEPLIPRA
jgi:hypothetical protein